MDVLTPARRATNVVAMVDLEAVCRLAQGTGDPGGIEAWLGDDELLQAVHDDVGLLDALAVLAAGDSGIARLAAEAFVVGGNPQGALDVLGARVKAADDDVCFERLAEIFCDDPVLGNASDAAEEHLTRPADAPVRARRLAFAAAMFRVAHVHTASPSWHARSTAALTESRALDAGAVAQLPKLIAILLRGQ